MISFDTQLRRHEAGHAIAAYLCSQNITRICVTSGRGHVAVESRRAFGEPAMLDAVRGMAGPAADTVWSRESIMSVLRHQLSYPDSDVANLRALGLTPAAPLTPDYVIDIASGAARQLLRIPLVRRLGMELADHLREHPVMERQDCDRYIADRWTQHSEDLPYKDDVVDVYARHERRWLRRVSRAQ